MLSFHIMNSKGKVIEILSDTKENVILRAKALAKEKNETLEVNMVKPVFTATPNSFVYEF